MDENERQLIDLLSRGHKDDSQEARDMILDATSHTDNVPILLHILEIDQTPVTANIAGLYLYQTVKYTFKQTTDEEREMMKGATMDHLSRTIPTHALRFVVDSIEYIYQHDENDWPEIIEYTFTQLENESSYFFALSLIRKFVEHMKSSKLEELLPNFLVATHTALYNDDKNIWSIGLDIFTILVQRTINTTDIAESIGEHLARIITIATTPEMLDPDVLNKLWDNLTKLTKEGIFDESEHITEFLKTALLVASNNELEIVTRAASLDFIEENLEQAGSFIDEVLAAALHLTAAQIEADGAVPSDEMTIFNRAYYAFPHEQINGIVLELINEAIGEDSEVPLRAAGLLVLRVMINSANDCARQITDEIIGSLEAAISSCDVILTEAACVVLAGFSGGYAALSSRAHSFIADLVRLTVEENQDIRQSAAKALCSVLGVTDSTSLAGVFDTLIETLPSVPDETKPDFIRALASAIHNEEDFDDEKSDSVIQLIRDIAEDGNTDNVCASFDLAVQLIKADEAQTDDVLDILLQSVQGAIELAADPEQLVANSTLVSNIVSAIDFLNGAAGILREEAEERIGSFYAPVIELMKSAYSNIAKAALRAVATFSKFSENEEMFAELSRFIDGALRTEKPSTMRGAIYAILQTLQKTEPPARLEYYNLIMNQIANEKYALDLVQQCFECAGSLIAAAGEEEAPAYLERAAEIIAKAVNAELPILNGSPMAESGATVYIFESFCNFLTEYFRKNPAEGNEVAVFLLQWLTTEDENGFDYNASGALIAAAQSEAVSEETIGQIFAGITQKLETANDPSMQQNVAFFLNVVSQNNADLAADVASNIGKIEEWRVFGLEQKHGYGQLLANIGSLYLTLAARGLCGPSEIAAGLELFPPADASETGSMMRNAIELYRKGVIVGPLQAQFALAIARFVVWDEDSIEEAEVPPELTEELFGVFHEILAAEGSLADTIQRAYAKQRSKLAKISSFISSSQ